jgi:hypothetical protein
MFVERRKAVIPIKTIRAAAPPGLKIERGSIPIASRSRMDLGVAAEEMEGLSDNLAKREVFCGFLILVLGCVYPTRVSQASRNASRQNARPRIRCSPCGEATGSGGDKPGSSQWGPGRYLVIPKWVVACCSGRSG